MCICINICQTSKYNFWISITKKVNSIERWKNENTKINNNNHKICAHFILYEN